MYAAAQLVQAHESSLHPGLPFPDLWAARDQVLTANSYESSYLEIAMLQMSRDSNAPDVEIQDAVCES